MSMSSNSERRGRDFGQEMEKAEEILANQRNGQRRVSNEQRGRREGRQSGKGEGRRKGGKENGRRKWE